MSPFPPIKLDRDAEVPLGIQLTWILRARVTGGDLAPGERLPGARELAAQAGVNVNTVRTVFARLEDEGLLTVVHGKGTFVADGAEAAAARRAGRAGHAGAAPVADDAAALAAEVISEARRRGVDARALAAALYVHPAGGASAADEPAARRALREEIAGLERELAALPAPPAKRDTAAGRATPFPSEAGRLLSIDELARLRDELAEQVRQARATEAHAARGSEAPPHASPAPARTTTVRGARLRWVPGG